MRVEEYIYVMAISLQLAGAVMLIVSYWFVSIKKQLDLLNKKKTRLENETLIIGQTQPSNTEFVQQICQNRIAFIYIAIGYLVGIFGNLNDARRITILLLVLVIAFVFTIIGLLISRKISEKF